ncbi:hypothetical protein [Ruminococcus sp.]|uniref:hypothetical protein n=1 Tax=Ruminococcus sp. TaxID=41978 RepID=UPI0025E9BAF9|nr:hypothetical protein [Ruminococcus sp.]MBQ8967379.1 hypothetical protein [Ruminococcus sp.]
MYCPNCGKEPDKIIDLRGAKVCGLCGAVMQPAPQKKSGKVRVRENEVNVVSKPSRILAIIIICCYAIYVLLGKLWEIYFALFIMLYIVSAVLVITQKNKCIFVSSIIFAVSGGIFSGVYIGSLVGLGLYIVWLLNIIITKKQNNIISASVVIFSVISVVTWRGWNFWHEIFGVTIYIVNILFVLSYYFHDLALKKHPSTT